MTIIKKGYQKQRQNGVKENTCMFQELTNYMQNNKSRKDYMIFI